MREIALGQYYPVDSVLHRLDPRTKIILMIAYITMIFFVKTFIGFGVVFVFLAIAIILSRVPVGKVLKSLKTIMFLVLFTVIMSLLFYAGKEEDLIWRWGIIKVYRAGLINAGLMALRLMFLVVGPTLLTFTTTPVALTDGLESLLKPLSYIKFPVHELAMIMSIALRLIPTLVEETDKIQSAQKARCADFESGTVFERAKAMIMAGVVFVNEQKVDKAGEMIKEDAKVEVRGHDIGYVSRGGLKLEKAMQCFPLTPNGKVCMDIGASTGGFTDCMLQNGAVKVYAVDVGYGQLAWSLRTDERVVNMERTNIRNVTPDMLEEPIEFFSVDVSFISLHHIFPVAQAITTPDAMGVCLVKPQFEAGREKVGKNGVVRDPATHREVLHNAMGYAAANGFAVRGLDFSPVKGPEGNIEYLMFVQKSEEPCVLDDAAAEQVVAASHSTLDR